MRAPSLRKLISCLYNLLFLLQKKEAVKSSDKNGHANGGDKTTPLYEKVESIVEDSYSTTRHRVYVGSSN